MTSEHVLVEERACKRLIWNFRLHFRLYFISILGNKHGVGSFEFLLSRGSLAEHQTGTTTYSFSQTALPNWEKWLGRPNDAEPAPPPSFHWIVVPIHACIPVNPLYLKNGCNHFTLYAPRTRKVDCGKTDGGQPPE